MIPFLVFLVIVNMILILNAVYTFSKYRDLEAKYEMVKEVFYDTQRDLKHRVRVLKTVAEAQNQDYCMRIARLEKYSPTIRLKEAKQSIMDKIKS